MSTKRWSHRLAKSQFSIFGIPRSVIMTIIGIKRNKIAGQNIFLRKPNEGPFLSWFFSASHCFCDFWTKFSSLFLWIKFHYTLKNFTCNVQPEHIVTITIFKNFGFFLKEVSLRSSLTQLPSPSPSPSCFPFNLALPSFSSYPSLHNPTSYPTFATITLVSIHELMF